MRDFENTFWWDILMRHLDEKFWWDILMGHFDETFSWDIFMRYFDKTFSWDIFMRCFDGLWRTLMTCNHLWWSLIWWGCKWYGLMTVLTVSCSSLSLAPFPKYALGMFYGELLAYDFQMYCGLDTLWHILCTSYDFLGRDYKNLSC